MSMTQRPIINEVAPLDSDELADDVRRGLTRTPKRLPSKYFYDARGSQLFEQICAQPEYYLTRTELAIMREHVGEIAARLGPDAGIWQWQWGQDPTPA